MHQHPSPTSLLPRLLLALAVTFGGATAAQATTHHLAYQSADATPGTTQLLDTTGPTPVVVGSRPGLIAAAGGRVFWFKPAPVLVPTVDCDCVANFGEDYDYDPDKPPAKCKRTRKHAVLAAHDMLNGKVVPLAKPGDGIGDEGGSSVPWTIEVLGQIGSFVVLADQRMLYSCQAAHPNADASLIVFDLSAGRVVGDGLAKADQAKLVAALGPRVVAHFKKAAAADDDTFDATDSVKVVAIRPRWVAGVLRPDYLFTVDWHHAGSDGAWGSYTRALWLGSDYVPAGLLPWRALPPMLAAHWGPKPAPEARFGWSVVDEVRREVVLRAFGVAAGQSGRGAEQPALAPVAPAAPAAAARPARAAPPVEPAAPARPARPGR